MLWHTETGAAQWDAVLPEDLQELRLVLAPDEGGPYGPDSNGSPRQDIASVFCRILCTLAFVQFLAFRLRVLPVLGDHAMTS